MPRSMRRLFAIVSCLGTLLALGAGTAVAQYQLTNLVSNQVGLAKHTDPMLVNAWGLVHGSGPFWISDEGTGWSTLYDGSGVKQGLQVVIPSESGQGPGFPTGIVLNGSQEFQIQGQGSVFLFATLDGTITGWVPGVNFNQALVAVDNSSSGASYTGLAITNNASGNHLFAADINNNKVDMYDGTFKLLSSFTDSTLPAGFAPFGIQDLNGLVYVTFAAQSGGSGGFIDIFSEGGVFLKQLAHGSPLNQPWGMAAATKAFGPLSNTLLVTNNLNHSGTINAFNAITGEFVGNMKDTNGKTLAIDQLWGIEFGGGSASNGGLNALFFTAGPNNNLAGTFGNIVFKP